jgi:DNA processing protein
LYIENLIDRILKEEELLYVLALMNTDGVGDILAKKLIAQFENAKNIFSVKRNDLLKITGIGPSVTKSLTNKNNFIRAEEEIAFMHKNKIGYYYFMHKNYPAYLKQCYDSPVLLFKKGAVDLVKKNIISIVGTRQMSGYGKSVLENLINDLKEYNPLIISGLAYGVDILAHKLALKHKLQTIAVLAHGLDRIYPPSHRSQAVEILNQGGLLTDFWSKTKPDKENFVKRNRIVAGLSQATIVIESAEKGGSLITADIANSYNRDVFAVPGRITDAHSRGCNNLIKTNRAALLTSAKDLAYILNWEKSNISKKELQKQLFVELSNPEECVYNYLLKEGKQQIDTIGLHCKLPIFKTASLLMTLELKGVVRPLPGKIFEVV